MLAFRRASVLLSNRGLSLGPTRISRVKPEIASCCFFNSCCVESFESHGEVLDVLVCWRRFYNTSSGSTKLHLRICNFSSQAGAKSISDQDDRVENAVPELDSLNSVGQETIFGDEMDVGLNFESDGGVKRPHETEVIPAMTRALLASPSLPVCSVMDNWVEAGNEVNLREISSTMLHLREWKMYFEALELSEWLETKKLNWTKSKYASRVDLIAKVYGCKQAEKYIKLIPESSRSEIVYGAVLANYVSIKNMEKAEQLFNKMKNLFPVTRFSCAQMILLYIRTDRKKLDDFLLFMEEENINHSPFTYRLLIDLKGQSRDITGMKQLVEKMKSEGMETNLHIQATMARHYAARGLNDEAEVILKEMEGVGITRNRFSYRFLLPIYASLGKADEVGRIWKHCEPNPTAADCTGAIEAFGILKKIKDAEAAFEKLLKVVDKPSSRQYAALLQAYRNAGNLTKGKALVKRMADCGVLLKPMAWDALVKLYAEAGELEAARAVLKMALRDNSESPLVTSYLTLLNHYANKGDVHNAEKIFDEMRLVGYPVKLRSYKSLLKAYINGKTPANGFHERLKGDYIFPDKEFTGLLAQADAVKRSFAAELPA